MKNTYEVKHEPSVDDKGDWYVYKNGKRVGPGYWSKEDAEAVVDHLYFVENGAPF